MLRRGGAVVQRGDRPALAQTSVRIRPRGIPMDRRNDLAPSTRRRASRRLPSGLPAVPVCPDNRMKPSSRAISFIESSSCLFLSESSKTP
jgi:hypothetical protein